jgi:hypothetical protein
VCERERERIWKREERNIEWKWRVKNEKGKRLRGGEREWVSRKSIENEIGESYNERGKWRERMKGERMRDGRGERGERIRDGREEREWEMGERRENKRWERGERIRDGREEKEWEMGERRENKRWERRERGERIRDGREEREGS